jgi:hypothetical protein
MDIAATRICNDVSPSFILFYFILIDVSLTHPDNTFSKQQVV